jgi:hypothetical protein
LNVALNWAKRKMILVAPRSVFTIFSTDEETFANAQIWKNLLRRTCTEQLWQGYRNGVHVEIWGNAVRQQGCALSNLTSAKRLASVFPRWSR